MQCCRCCCCCCCCATLPAETVNSRGSSSNRNLQQQQQLQQAQIDDVAPTKIALTFSRPQGALSLQASLQLLLLVLLLSWSLQIFNALILMLINLEVAATFALLSLRDGAGGREAKRVKRGQRAKGPNTIRQLHA